MRQPVSFTSKEGALHQYAVSRPHIDTTSADQQRVRGRRLQLTPQLIGTQNQRHIIRRFKIGVADDPRRPTVAAQLVYNLELLKRNDTASSAA